MPVLRVFTLDSLLKSLSIRLPTIVDTRTGRVPADEEPRTVASRFGFFSVTWYNQTIPNLALKPRRAFTMKHLDADSQPEAVRQFLLSLNVKGEGLIVECGGRVIHVMQPSETTAVEDIQAGYEELQAGKGRPFAEADAAIRSELGFAPRQQ